MFKQFRPEPLSPDGRKRNFNLNLPNTVKYVSVSPGKLRDSQNFISTKAIEDISTLKIFDEANDEGPQVSWTDKLKQYRHLSPSVADSVNNITMKSEIYQSINNPSNFFSKRNQMNRASPNRDSHTEFSHNDVSLKPRLASPNQLIDHRIRVHRNKLNTQAAKSPLPVSLFKNNSDEK